ncbi:hypothetical protein L1F06_015525 [Ectopseudomonas hydrolytica]|jgi:hypothetical protein|uniref:Bro-N domain-containing protein n=1 Tax=Ectopseudomonas hydrolytica TaxID=2493633 RepID=A0ABY5A2N5_9GAMM|nr:MULTISPECIES: hypothetical protein [Pseudomonas]USR38080.1 hypothetical protein L1F06_015525 [Pseudomonas hydrolytica]
MTDIELLFTSVVYSITLRVLGLGGRSFMTAEDLAAVLEYRTAGSITTVFSRHRTALEPLSIKARIDGVGHAVRLFDEAGVRYICQYSKRPGAIHLLQWLDAGGMKIDQQPPVPEVETLPVEDVELLPPPRHVPSLRLVPRGPDPMQQLLEREKAYCRDLVKTFLRYCESEEVDKLTGMIDGQIDHLLETRYCPGLNAARYELYRKYWMQGGAQ